VKPIMAPETENLVLEHLRYMRGRIDIISDDIREIKTRVGLLEQRFAILEQQYASMSSRIDRIEGRLDRIERRLELTDA